MEPLEIQPGLVIPASELSAGFSRASGPGGQHVNKSSTRVILRFALAHSTALPDDVRQRLRRLAGSRLTREGDLLIVGQRHRSQLQNLEDCRERLRSLVLRALAVPRPRRATRPSRAAIDRRLAAKTHRSRTKQQRQGGSRFPIDD